MGIFSWILLGLIAGALAKFIMPGKDPGGIFVTILIGIAGAMVFLAASSVSGGSSHSTSAGFSSPPSAPSSS